ncbi:ABC transporter substrate-binding protein [Desulforudis sp. 1088]|uniref:ABC transporter substrate-binding protein n=1 Tax=unclassified Candidatus Desulforudis TaxID=2635950 RepID=UPI003CE5022A
MRQIKLIACILVIAALIAGFAGCSKQSSQEGANLQVKQELVVGLAADANELKFKEVGIGSPNANIYESLVKLNADYQVEPLLATRWEYRGSNTWRFYLREGVKFHNGEELTAEAVKQSLEEEIRPSGKSILKIEKGSVKVVDKHTIDIVTTEPNMRVPEILAHPLYGIRAPGVDPVANPTGTGPFRFVRYEKDKELVVERNPDYWGTPPKLDKVTFKYIPDHNTRLMALQAGEVDVVKEIPREMLGQAKAMEGVRLATAPQGPYVALSLMVNGKPPHDILRDKTVRQAIGWAIDREAIIQKVWEGNADESQTVIPAGILGEHKNLVQGFGYDPAKAGQLLDDAGWKPGPDGIRTKNGRRLELTLVSGFPSASVLKPLPEVLQQQLRDVGIDVRIVEVADDGLYYGRLEKGEGDLWLERGNQNNGDPTFLPELLYHSRGYQGSTYNKPFWPGEEFDRLIDEARNSPDIREAARLMAEAMHILIDKESTVVPIAALYNVYAVKEKVQGLSPHPADINTRWDTAYIKG